MALRIVWSPEAVEDLESIAEYISRDSESYAKAVVTKVIDLVQRLGGYPLIGRVVPEINDKSIRERFAYSYRIIYRVEKDRILVLAVVHGKRLLDSVSDRFE